MGDLFSDDRMHLIYASGYHPGLMLVFAHFAPSQFPNYETGTHADGAQMYTVIKQVARVCDLHTRYRGWSGIKHDPRKALLVAQHWIMTDKTGICAYTQEKGMCFIDKNKLKSALQEIVEYIKACGCTLQLSPGEVQYTKSGVPISPLSLWVAQQYNLLTLTPPTRYWTAAI